MTGHSNVVLISSTLLGVSPHTCDTLYSHNTLAIGVGMGGGGGGIIFDIQLLQPGLETPHNFETAYKTL